ncbi:HD domain-containing protein 2-like isoform X2 [Terrapene carolina triunguis]|uniref:HD domain-containing protein 2-like isoform X2 n=1 Tax=Terrapene triunguis TaxID=2587831 RepID=UPI000E773D6B|nr:HD domain-containing protein 2-like isoform X2 [Terrapene carolina triunguis]
MFYIVKTISKQRVPRTGWVYRNVEKPESVSDHMYRMAVMALVTEDKQLNKDRCVRLALVHDMAECIVGDIAPADNISKEEKHQREEKTKEKILYSDNGQMKAGVCLAGSYETFDPAAIRRSEKRNL